jgi:hypothetical protein
MVWMSEVVLRRKPFLVGVEDRDQRAFGDVEPLAQQVDADQHVEDALAQVADDLDPLQRVHVGMEVAAAYAGLRHVLGQVLRHALGQRGDQHAAALLRDDAAFRQQVVHLALDRADLGDGVHQAGRADHLLGEGPAGALHFPRAGGGADEDGVRAVGVPLLEFEGTVVHAGGQAEAELVQDRLPREVAAVHAADLRHGHVALVDDQQGVVGQVFEERGGGSPGFRPVR